jgi:ribosomal protein S12 methylthiotransferase
MLMGLMEAHGYQCTHDSDDPQGEIVVINTCGFIADAKEESINTILEFAQAKTEGKIKKLFVMGCLSERYLADLEEEIPEVDGWYGKFNYKQLLDTLNDEHGTLNDEHGTLNDECGTLNDERGTLNDECGTLNDECGTLNDALPDNNVHCSTFNVHRKLTTPRHYAYLKISEGCDRHCAYCAIPLITGKHQSRPMQEILDEVRWLVSQGVKEFNVIAQELTYYGIDIDGQQHIAELIEQMADIPGVEWIRLHYAYPTHFPWDLLRVMREKANVCKYLDIALQHISDNMLSRMKRNVSKQETYDLVEKLRKEVPGICLRTTLMVGFPGETDEDFAELIAFTKWARFERMGAFAYSEEEGTYSEQHYEDDVPEEVKQQRLDKLMRIQQNISAEVEAQKVGTIQRVVIDRQEGDWFIGRTEYCSPEVDPEVLIPASEQLTIGNFYMARITDSEEFDLYATTKI